MSIYCVNEIIKKARAECKISQEELAMGICAVSTLSKIENGIEEPNRNTVEELMNRMGRGKGLYGTYPTEEKFDISIIKYNLMQMVFRGECEEVFRNIEINQQVLQEEKGFLKFLQVYQNLVNGSNELQKCTYELEKLIKKEEPDAGFNHLNNQFYSLEQLTYYLHLSICYGKMEQQSNRRDLLESIYGYLDNNIDYDGEYDELTIVVLKEIASSYIKDEHYKKALQYIELAHKECIKHKKSCYLNEIYQKKSEIYEHLNDRQNLDECKYFIQILNEIFGKGDLTLKVKKTIPKIPFFYS